MLDKKRKVIKNTEVESQNIKKLRTTSAELMTTSVKFKKIKKETGKEKILRTKGWVGYFD
jgi:hypothetical protein